MNRKGFLNRILPIRSRALGNLKPFAFSQIADSRIRIKGRCEKRSEFTTALVEVMPVNVRGLCFGAFVTTLAYRKWQATVTRSKLLKTVRNLALKYNPCYPTVTGHKTNINLKP